jgi:hypothetical protein
MHQMYISNSQVSSWYSSRKVGNWKKNGKIVKEPKKTNKQNTVPRNWAKSYLWCIQMTVIVEMLTDFSVFQLFWPEHHWRDFSSRNAHLVHQNWYRVSFTLLLLLTWSHLWYIQVRVIRDTLISYSPNLIFGMSRGPCLPLSLILN